MKFLSLYFPLLFSLSLSFLIHTVINSFKKQIQSFLGLASTYKSINLTNDATDGDKLHLESHHPISSTATTRIIVSPPSPVGFDDDIGGGVDEFMRCTESLGFESIDERRVDDHIHTDEIHDNNSDKDDDDNDDDGDGCWKWMRAAEVKSYPPPLSSLNKKGQPSFVLTPVRKNGRLELTKVRTKRPDILYASRQDGRLRLYLVPDDVEDQEELVEEQEGDIIVESAEEEEEVVEEIRGEKEEDRVGEWNKFPTGGGGNQGSRRCYQVVNQCYHVRGNHHHLRMYGVGIA